MSELIKKLIIRFKRAIAFGLVGCVNTLVDFAVFTACHGFAGLSPELSQVVGYLSGIVCSFILNRSVTFRDWTGKLWMQIARFLAVNGASLLVSTLLMRLLTGWGLNAYIAKIGVTGVGMFMNYFGYKLIVFRIRDSSKESDCNE